MPAVSIVTYRPSVLGVSVIPVPGEINCRTPLLNSCTWLVVSGSEARIGNWYAPLLILRIEPISWRGDDRVNFGAYAVRAVVGA